MVSYIASDSHQRNVTVHLNIPGGVQNSYLRVFEQLINVDYRYCTTSRDTVDKLITNSLTMENITLLYFQLSSKYLRVASQVMQLCGSGCAGVRNSVRHTMVLRCDVVVNIVYVFKYCLHK